MRVVWIALALLAGLPCASLADGWGLPSESWGIGVGNSPRFSGVRLNIADKDVERVNGLNLTLGVPIAPRHYGPLAGEFTGLNLGLLGPLGRRFAGITLSPTIMRAEEYDGIMIAAAMMHDTRLRGLAVSPIIVDGELAAIDGLAIAGFAVRAERLRGAGLGLVGNPVREMTGLLAGAINVNEVVTGIQIGLWNDSERLHGIQIGLINRAGNNRPGLRYLPLVNAHFGARP